MIKENITEGSCLPRCLFFWFCTEQVILNIFKSGKENRNKLALFCSECVTAKKLNTVAFKKEFSSIFFSLCVCVCIHVPTQG